MNEAATWASIAAAALTAVTALLALRISSRQAETSRRQLDVDLYHLRVVIYEKVANTEARLNYKPDLPVFIDELKGLVQRTDHLFGPSAKSDLTKLIDALIDFDIDREHAEPGSKPTLLDRVHEIRRHKQKLVQVMNPKVNLHRMDGGRSHPLLWVDDILDWLEGKHP